MPSQLQKTRCFRTQYLMNYLVLFWYKVYLAVLECSLYIAFIVGWKLGWPKWPFKSFIAVLNMPNWGLTEMTLQKFYCSFKHAELSPSKVLWKFWTSWNYSLRGFVKILNMPKLPLLRFYCSKNPFKSLITVSNMAKLPPQRFYFIWCKSVISPSTVLLQVKNTFFTPFNISFHWTDFLKSNG